MIPVRAHRILTKRLSAPISLILVNNGFGSTAQIIPRMYFKGMGSSRRQEINKFIVFCNTRITEYGRNGDIDAAESIFRRMSGKNAVSWTAMLTAYANNGQLDKARKLFNEMPERVIASWNAMISAYMQDINLNEAFKLFYIMPERNSITYSAMIKGYLNAGMPDNALKLYNGLPGSWRDPICSNALISGYLKMGNLDEAVRVFDGMQEKNVVSITSIIDGFCKKGKIHEARNLFDTMSETNVVSWTTIINGYVKLGFFLDGFDLFMKMRRGIEANANALTVMVEACGCFGREKQGVQIHCLASRLGFVVDIFLGNSVICMYCKTNHMVEAHKAFEFMDDKDIVSWNSLIAGYVENNQIANACILFDKIPRKDAVSWTALVKGFFNEGDTKRSMELFERIPTKDDIAWTTVISGFAGNGKYEDAIQWFVKMLRSDVKPNPLALSSVLSSSASLVTLNQGVQFHAYAFKVLLETDLSIQNSLVSFYSKCACLLDAYKVFRCIIRPNIVSYNSLITGSAQNGFTEQVFTLFYELKEVGLDPNEITFLALLSACAHMGLVHQGKKFFQQMKSFYCIVPTSDHYACMVHLLGRAGLLDDAMALIQSMPCEPHSGVWGALLGASEIHLRLDVTDFAAQRFFELEPCNAIPYVVLSRLHVAFGRNLHGEKVRNVKESKGVKKNPGCSWITVKDKVHCFFAEDNFHLEIEQIKVSVLMMMTHIKMNDKFSLSSFGQMERKLCSIYCNSLEKAVMANFSS